VLNLHSMCGAQRGKTAFLFWFLTYLSFSHLSLFFLISPFSSYLFSVSLRSLSPCFLLFCFFSLYIYQHQFHLHTDSTAPFHSTVLVKLQFFLCKYSLIIFLNRRLLFCDTVYCVSLPIWISVFNFPAAGTPIGWIHASMFQAAGGDPFGVATGFIITASAAVLR